MSCFIKNIPSSEKVIIGTGNRGGGFPLVTLCDTINQPIPQTCYLSLEEGTDPDLGALLLVGPPPFSSPFLGGFWTYDIPSFSVQLIGFTVETDPSGSISVVWGDTTSNDVQSATPINHVFLAGPYPFTPADNLFIAAPCVSADVTLDCFIALQENETLAIELQENQDYFLTDCSI